MYLNSAFKIRFLKLWFVMRAFINILGLSSDGFQKPQNQSVDHFVGGPIPVVLTEKVNILPSNKRSTFV